MILSLIHTHTHTLAQGHLDTWTQTGGDRDRLPNVRLMDDLPKPPNENIQIPVIVWMQTGGERHRVPNKIAFPKCPNSLTAYT